jgi:hypothetical protein
MMKLSKLSAAIALSLLSGTALAIAPSHDYGASDSSWTGTVSSQAGMVHSQRPGVDELGRSSMMSESVVETGQTDVDVLGRGMGREIPRDDGLSYADQAQASEQSGESRKFIVASERWEGYSEPVPSQELASAAPAIIRPESSQQEQAAMGEQDATRGGRAELYSQLELENLSPRRAFSNLE